MLRYIPTLHFQIYYDAKTHRYLIRVWGRTLMEGTVDDGDDGLADLCGSVFDMSLACAGVLDPSVFVPSDGSRHFAVTQFPFERQVSKQCRAYYKLPDRPTAPELKGIGLCKECSMAGFQKNDLFHGDEDEAGDEDHKDEKKFDVAAEDYPDGEDPNWDNDYEYLEDFEAKEEDDDGTVTTVYALLNRG